MDPEVATRLIRFAFENVSLADLDRAASASAKAFLLVSLIADAQLDDAGLDEFLSAARKAADQSMRLREGDMSVLAEYASGPRPLPAG